MAQIHCFDISMKTCKSLVHAHQPGADFVLINSNLEKVSLKKFKKEPLIIQTYPCIDLEIAFATLVKLKQSLKGRKINCLGVSYDLPFTLKRTQTDDEIDGISLLSAYQDRHFGAAYGIEILDGPFKGLLSSATFVLDAKHHLIYQNIMTDLTEQVTFTDAFKALDKACK